MSTYKAWGMALWGIMDVDNLYGALYEFIELPSGPKPAPGHLEILD